MTKKRFKKNKRVNNKSKVKLGSKTSTIKSEFKSKRDRPSDADLNKMKHKDFVVWFLDYNKSVISRYIARRLIPNRYDPSDIISYMAERMLDILKKRKAKGRAIKNPRIYFSKLIDFWCIEYQRMHGYCYGMPKRPRCPEAEQEIGKHGFVYFEAPMEGSASTAYGFMESPALSYIDINITDSTAYEPKGYILKGDDPGKISPAWINLMRMIQPEDRPVMDCLFRRDMTIPETSKFLDIAVSTAYTRRDRALLTLSGYLASSLDLDENSWKIIADLPKIPVDNLYKN